MTSIRAVLSKDRVKKSGGYALVIQVIHLRKKRVMCLGCDLLEANFDSDKESVVYDKNLTLSRKDVKKINMKIEHLKQNLHFKLETLQCSGVAFTAADIISNYRKDRNDIYLKVYMQKQINEKRRIGKMGIAEAYQSTMRSLLRHLGDRNIVFDDINIMFLRDYENFLMASGVVDNTINYYMRNLRTIYNRAYEDGLITHGHNPFRKYHLHTIKTEKRALKREEIRRIATLDLSGHSHLAAARDFFMFSFYTRGMSPIDILYLRHQNIVDGVIYYRRQKTQQPLQVAITSPLRQLLNSYDTDPIYVLPFIVQHPRSTLRAQYKAAYAQINLDLKRVAVLAGIHTPLTTYVARHSWASIARRGGAPTAAISEGLGHTSEKTTLIYLSNFDRTVIDRINRRVVTL